MSGENALFTVEIVPSYVSSLTISGVEEEKKITLDSSSKRADGETVIGYDGTIASVEIESAIDNGAGGTYYMIGSYGVY